MVRVVPTAQDCLVCGGKLRLLNITQNQWKCEKCGRNWTKPKYNVRQNVSYQRCPFCSGSVRLIDAAHNRWKCDDCGSEMTKPLSPTPQKKPSQVPPRWFQQKYGRL